MDGKTDAINRRTLLARTGGLAATLALPGAYWGSRTSARGPRAATVGGGPLRIPRVISEAEITLPMRKAAIPILPGKRTEMWTYGGEFPGPTIRRPAGETTKVTFKHQLPTSAGELSAHLHGGHSTASDDGHPGGLTESQPRSLYCDISPKLSPRESGNDLLIEPGGQRTYTYDLLEDGAPERSAFQWYHDHRLDQTARNVWRGLAGMWIIDDPLDMALPLPKGNRDIPLMLCDRSFDRHNQLTNPFRNTVNPPHDQVTGKHILVNGSVLPKHKVKPLRYRLRILNASNFRAYNLDFGDRTKVTQIGTDSGLMPGPVERSKVLVGPGERVELIVDFHRAKGKTVVLRSVARAKRFKGLGSQAYVGPLMKFRVAESGPADHTSIPSTLRSLPGWVASAPSTPSHVWKMTVGSGIRPSWEINGRSFDPSYAEVEVQVDTTVTWDIVNSTKVAHLFHIHGTDWYMLSRNNKSPAKHERCLKETFFLDPGERIRVAGRISDHLGKFVVHCHMLDHEDHGLMSQYEVVGST